jgi:Hydrazine synthase alpha subunit middle domain
LKASRSNLRIKLSGGSPLQVLRYALVWIAAGILAACSSGAGNVQTASGQSADPATVDFPIFYVKRYSVPTQAATQAPSQDLRMLRFAIPSADLYMRTRAAPSGIETNVTARITGTGTKTAANYDIKDVSVSADGTTILFAMRGPLTTNMQQDKAPSWRIWQYLIASDTLSLLVNPATDPDPATVNDVAPQFLPDGRVVFTSTRQRQSQAILLDEGKPQFIAQDEATTEPAFVLHVINTGGDGGSIHQISFNQSHDRDPTVLANGRVMWTRWDDAPGKNGMHLYSANPDGTDVELLYGANSHATGTTADGLNNNTIQFVKTHEMQDGRILALVRPFAYANVNDTGGDLIIIDTKDYVENTQPALAGSSLTGPAQSLATTNPVLTVPGPSPGGRFYSGFPLWDGTGRILVSWTQCRVLTAATSSAPQACTSTSLADPTVKSAPPVYSVWMFDPSANTLQPIMQPTDGIMITDVVAAQPRTLPTEIVDQQPGVTLDQDMASAGVGEIDIRSVYDFDGVDTAKPSTAAVANPAVTAPNLRLARFIRLEKPVSIPDPKFLKLDAAAFGVTPYMREILGYAPVQPDGSVVIQVPAYVAFQISILDATGKRITPVHDAWLQVIPGETIHCTGCHTPAAQQNPLPGQSAVSHGRAGAFASAYAGGTASIPFLNSQAGYTTNTGTSSPLVPTMAGQTMAETLSTASCGGDTPHCLQDFPSVNLVYTDIWTLPSAAPLGTPIALAYDSTLSSNLTWQFPTAAACLAAWSSTCRIILNYNEQIQPLWTVSRTYTGGVAAGQTGACSMCHGPTSAGGVPQVPAGVTQLDLTNTASNEEPLQPVSYRRLLFAHDEQQLMMGALTDVMVTGPVDPTTGLPTQVPVTIGPPMNAGTALGSTQFFNEFATGGTHAGYLSPAELRVISEWLDIGAQYFNNPFDPLAPLD